MLDRLYDETAVLKCIADWPAAKWEALWEGAVMHKQLTSLQQQCGDCAAQQASVIAATAAAAAAAAGSSGAGSSSSSRKKGPGRATRLAAAAAAAQQTFAAVSTKLDAYQRQESGLEKRLKAQGVPWNGPQLVAAVKEAAVQLGVLFVDASLGLLQASEQTLQQTQQQLSGGGGKDSSASSSGSGGALGATSLLGCVVQDEKQQHKLQAQLRRQARQHEQTRRQQLDDAVTFLFKLHQFSGGFDDQGMEAFCGLAEEFQKQQQQAAAAVAVV